MNIATAPGEKVRFVGTSGEDKEAREFADRFLVRGEVYTVASVFIVNMTSYRYPKANVYLQEFPYRDEGDMNAMEFPFDAALFDNVTEGEDEAFRVCRRWHKEYNDRKAAANVCVYSPSMLRQGIK